MANIVSICHFFLLLSVFLPVKWSASAKCLPLAEVTHQPSSALPDDDILRQFNISREEVAARQQQQRAANTASSKSASAQQHPPPELSSTQQAIRIR